MNNDRFIGNLNPDIMTRIFEYNPSRSILNTSRINRTENVYNTVAMNVVNSLEKQYNDLQNLAKYADIDDLITYLSYKPLTKSERVQILIGLASRKPEYFQLFKDVIDTLDKPEETLVVLKPMMFTSKYEE